MLELTIIGNLTADATIKDWNGKSFIAFNIAENQQYTGADGVKREKTTYVSCLKPIRGENSGIAQYLRKGTQVYARGRASAKPFSRGDGTLDASLNCSVDYVQLLGGARKEQNSPSEGVSHPQTDNLPSRSSEAPQKANTAPQAGFSATGYNMPQAALPVDDTLPFA